MAGPQAMRRPPRPVKPAYRAAAWIAAAAALAAVFAAYLQPQLAFELATRAWACF